MDTTISVRRAWLERLAGLFLLASACTSHPSKVTGNTPPIDATSAPEAGPPSEQEQPADMIPAHNVPFGVTTSTTRWTAFSVLDADDYVAVITLTHPSLWTRKIAAPGAIPVGFSPDQQWFVYEAGSDLGVDSLFAVSLTSTSDAPITQLTNLGLAPSSHNLTESPLQQLVQWTNGALSYQNPGHAPVVVTLPPGPVLP